MQKFKRLFVAAFFGMAITIGLTFFMISLIGLSSEAKDNDNYLTTQVKVSSPPGLEPAKEINSDSKKKHHKLPSKRKIKIPLDFKSLNSQLMAQTADGNQDDPLAAPKTQQKVLIQGSKSQASVKLAGKFNVIGADPKYPDGAFRVGMEGWVEAMIHVSKDGFVNQVNIINADPSGVFDSAVVTAVSKWRLELDLGQANQFNEEYFHRFEFKITD